MMDGKLRFSIRDEIALAEFSQKYLVFQVDRMRLLEINRTANRILEHIRGGESLEEIVASISTAAEKTDANIANEIKKLITDLLAEGVIEARVKWLKNGEESMSKKAKFMGNPDVSCRVEDEDGAILYNPDSNSVQIINPIGLHIWQFLEKLPRSLEEITDHIKKLYADVPADSVEKDIRDYVMVLKTKGFIGEVADESM